MSASSYLIPNFLPKPNQSDQSKADTDTKPLSQQNMSEISPKTSNTESNNRWIDLENAIAVASVAEILQPEVTFCLRKLVTECFL